MRAELLESVAEYLFAELRPEVPREQRFRVLVAANVCAVVARELRAGDAPDRRRTWRCSSGCSGEPQDDAREAAGRARGAPALGRARRPDSRSSSPSSPST